MHSKQNDTPSDSTHFLRQFTGGIEGPGAWVRRVAIVAVVGVGFGILMNQLKVNLILNVFLSILMSVLIDVAVDLVFLVHLALPALDAHDRSVNTSLQKVTDRLHELAMDVFDWKSGIRGVLEFFVPPGQRQTFMTNHLVATHGLARLGAVRPDLQACSLGVVHVYDSRHALEMIDGLLTGPSFLTAVGSASRSLLILDHLSTDDVPKRERGGDLQEQTRFGRIARFASRIARLSARADLGLAEVKRVYFINSREAILASPNCLWVMEQNLYQDQCYRHKYSYVEGPAHLKFAKPFEDIGLKGEQFDSWLDRDWGSNTEGAFGTAMFVFDNSSADPYCAVLLPAVCAGNRHDQGAVVVNPDIARKLYALFAPRLNKEKALSADEILGPLARHAPKYSVLFLVRQFWAESCRAGAKGFVVSLDTGLLANHLDTWQDDSFYQKVMHDNRELCALSTERNFTRIFWVDRNLLSNLARRDQVLTAAAVASAHAQAGVTIGFVSYESGSQQQLRDFSYFRYLTANDESYEAILELPVVTDSEGQLAASPRAFRFFASASVLDSVDDQYRSRCSGQPNAFWSSLECSPPTSSRPESILGSKVCYPSDMDFSQPSSLVDYLLQSFVHGH